MGAVAVGAARAALAQRWGVGGARGTRGWRGGACVQGRWGGRRGRSKRLGETLIAKSNPITPLKRESLKKIDSCRSGRGRGREALLRQGARPSAVGRLRTRCWQRAAAPRPESEHARAHMTRAPAPLPELAGPQQPAGRPRHPGARPALHQARTLHPGRRDLGRGQPPQPQDPGVSLPRRRRKERRCRRDVAGQPRHELQPAGVQLRRGE